LPGGSRGLGDVYKRQKLLPTLKKTAKPSLLSKKQSKNLVKKLKPAKLFA
jgi:hypothetical protein